MNPEGCCISTGNALGTYASVIRLAPAIPTPNIHNASSEICSCENPSLAARCAVTRYPTKLPSATRIMNGWISTGPTCQSLVSKYGNILMRPAYNSRIALPAQSEGI